MKRQWLPGTCCSHGHHRNARMKAKQHRTFKPLLVSCLLTSNQPKSQGQAWNQGLKRHPQYVTKPQQEYGWIELLQGIKTGSIIQSATNLTVCTLFSDDAWILLLESKILKSIYSTPDWHTIVFIYFNSDMFLISEGIIIAFVLYSQLSFRFTNTLFLLNVSLPTSLIFHLRLFYFCLKKIH